MSYVIDVYRGEARPMRRFTDYMCFEAFFPDLVAGPIIRYAAMEEQMRVRQHTADKFARGVAFFALRDGQEDPDRQPDGPHRRHRLRRRQRCTRCDAWFGVLGYAFQIYFDFSGYSDMAVGLALMMGFVLIQNFDSPYKADSITDFWRRWHISLSHLAARLPVHPAGRQPARAPARTYVNLMTVMLLGGLWHGASWNFVIWGAIHGGMLAAERAQGKSSPYRRLPRAGAGGHHLLRGLSVLGVLPGQDPAPGAGLPAVDVRPGRRSASRPTPSPGSLYTPYHVGHAGAGGARRVGDAQHLGVHQPHHLAPGAWAAWRCWRCRS